MMETDNDTAHLPGRGKSLMPRETVMRPRSGAAPVSAAVSATIPDPQTRSSSEPDKADKPAEKSDKWRHS